jgi:hypothetical protein
MLGRDVLPLLFRKKGRNGKSYWKLEAKVYGKNVDRSYTTA